MGLNYTIHVRLDPELPTFGGPPQLLPITPTDAPRGVAHECVQRCLGRQTADSATAGGGLPGAHFQCVELVQWGLNSLWTAR